jgi:hypothetical protein
MAGLRWTGTIVLAAVVAGGGPVELLGGEEHGDPATTEPERRSRLQPRKTPLADSVDRVVATLIRERYSPCGTTQSVPCFPVSVELEGRHYSVRETLENLELGDGPVPGTLPTASEMIQHGANPHPTSAGVGFDFSGFNSKAIGCKTKQLLKKIQGKAQTYYLYRVWDETGERAVLRDRPFTPDSLAGSPYFNYVPLGEFGDECEAIAAYRRSMHELRAQRESDASTPRPQGDDGPE